MRKLLSLFLVLFVFLGLNAQDTIPDLIISEARLDGHQTAYFELCNVGDSALDLSSFVLQEPQGSGEIMYFEEGMILPAGATYVVANTYDDTDDGWPEIQEKADFLLYQSEKGPLFEDGTLKDSVSPYYQILNIYNGRYGLVLWYKLTDIDSMIIDCVNWNRDESGETVKITGGYPIAGVVEPISSNTVIRKTSVSQGNLGDWDVSRGTDAADSEWLLLEHTDPPGLPFSTVGNHGNATIEVGTANTGITIDLSANKLTLPWGLYKGDSVVSQLILGDGLGWQYLESAVFEDSVHTIAQSGDALIIKAVGDAITEKTLSISVTVPVEEMNKAYPKRQLVYPDLEEDPIGTLVSWGNTRFYVTDGMPTIDTIGNVGFATRVDTLFKYLEWAPEANAEIVWVDGNVRVDLENGDKLKVISKSGAAKEYYIDVQEMGQSDEAALAAITWPDITMDDIFFDLRWTGDTVPEFSPSTYNYSIPLRYGNSKVPALKAYKSQLNAMVEIVPAVSLKGGFDERTTIINVTSESGLTVRTYKITFAVDIPNEFVQKFKGDPLFSEYHCKYETSTEWIEITNPGNQNLDLSRYLITWGQLVNPAQVIEADHDFVHRYQTYVPGFKFTDDPVAWEDGTKKNILEYDATDPNVDANGGTFVIAGRSVQKAMDKHPDYITENSFNIDFPNDGETRLNSLGLSFPNNSAVGNCRIEEAVYFLFRIDNDSILTGDKAIGDITDFTLIDQFGFEDGREFFRIAGYEGPGKNSHKIQRKPEIWQGNPSYANSGGTTPEDSEWTYYSYYDNPDGISSQEHFSTIGSHILDPVTAYKSTVSSLVYIVDPGYEGSLGIQGVSNGETVTAFITNLIPASEAQTLEVKSGTSGTVLDAAVAVSAGDTLVVTAEDGNTITKYAIAVDPLDSNTTLNVKTGSSLTIADGKVSGMVPGTALKTVLDEVETASNFSVLNVLNTAGELVPLKTLNVIGDYVDILASSSIWFEVVAQNGDKKMYQLKPAASAKDAYVLSDVYTVVESNLVIASVTEGVKVAAFFANLIPADGATMKIIDKAGYERTVGTIAYDDVLELVSEDKSVTASYELNFQMEDVGNQAPIVAITIVNTTIAKDAATSISADVSDDDLPAGATMTYVWSVSSGDAASVSFTDATAALTEVTITAAGTYTLEVTVSDGELSSSATVEVTVGSNSVESFRSAFRMYPNPARDALDIEMGRAHAEIGIYSITGKAVFNTVSENSKLRVDLSQFEAGIYFVSVKSGSEVLVRKLTIVR
ncbi:T9SS type A sorting domain-containing protein [Bacteroidota bacterium]